MSRGISPIIAVVLLLAITVIAAVGLYFWVTGSATQPPTPSTPRSINARAVSCAQTGNTSMIITNISPPGRNINSSDFKITIGELHCPFNVTMESKNQIFCNVSGFPEGSGTASVYGDNIASADVTC